MNKSFSQYLSLLVFFIISFTLEASHVVGGELQVKWKGSGTLYEIRLNMYVNQMSVENAQKQGYVIVDPLQTVYFTNSLADNFQFIAGLSLPLLSNKPIETNNNACATNAVIRTNLLIYSKVVDLGYILGNYGMSNYFITFEYCCRNELITNLYDPDYQNFSLYVKCPPLSYQNSSPSLKLLKNEYFCTNVLNTFDMGATDTDGDRIVYSLVAPLQTIVPRRYSDDPFYNITQPVTWKNSSYSGSNPIPGTQPLSINSTTGLLIFNPSAVGIYCFGILIQEYRGNVKIGEVRKDYQFNVQNCPINYKPVIAFKDNSIKEHDTLTVQLKGNTCFPIYVTDYDATKFFLSETILIKTKSTLPLNSSDEPYPKLGFTVPTEVPLTGFRDTIRFSACFNPCAGGLRLDKTTYYPFQLIINDNKCPAQYDTLSFTIKVEVNANAVPEVFIDPPTATKKVKVNESVSFMVYGTDADASDLLSLSVLNPQRGMYFQNVRDSSSTIRSTFSWQPTCADLNPGLYSISFVIKDHSCILNHADTISQLIWVYQEDVSFDDMKVTNLITPNGDGLNDSYHVPGIPLVGNCDKYFKSIEIYNRWGSRVFYSQDPAFNWHPDVSDGMYYFAIDLNYEIRKGWLQIMQ